MSIHKMIALHPDVGEDFNELLATAARHAMFCAEMCISCPMLASPRKWTWRSASVHVWIARISARRRGGLQFGGRPRMSRRCGSCSRPAHGSANSVRRNAPGMSMSIAGSAPKCAASARLTAAAPFPTFNESKGERRCVTTADKVMRRTTCATPPLRSTRPKALIASPRPSRAKMPKSVAMPALPEKTRRQMIGRVVRRPAQTTRHQRIVIANPDASPPCAAPITGWRC